MPGWQKNNGGSCKEWAEGKTSLLGGKVCLASGGEAAADVDLTAALSQTELPLPFPKPFAILIVLGIMAVATTHPLQVARQGPVCRREGHATAVAHIVLARLQPVIQGHALVENKTFATPAASFDSNVLEVVEIPSSQMMHPLVNHS